MSLETQSFAFGAFLLNAKERVLLRDGKPLPVTPKAFLLLSILVENHGHLVEKNELISQVWPDSFVEEGNLTFTIGLLRKALGDNSQVPHFIETVPRRGYRFIAEVSAAPDEMAANAPAANHFGYRTSAVFVAFCIILLSTLAVGTWVAKTKIFDEVPTPTILDVNYHSEKFSSSGKTLHASISPDGKLVAYVDETAGKWSVWLRKLETSENTLLVPPSDEYYFGLVFAHDGQTVYFVRKPPGGLERAGSNIYRISILGGVPEQIILGFIEGWISLSPDDGQLSFIRCHYKENNFCSLMIADTTGRNERQILTRPSPIRISDNQFSPDGKSIVFASGNSANGGRDFHLTKVDLESGVETPISSPAFFNIHNLKWLPDGESLLEAAMENLDGQSKLWQVSTTTGETNLLTKDSASFMGISLNKDASLMVSTQVSNNFQLYFSSQGQTKDLTHARQAIFAPDGNIVYSTHEGDIWAIGRDGSGQRQLTNSPDTDHFPCFSSNGRFIYFTSNRTGTNQVWRMNSDGSNQNQVTKTEGGYPTFVSLDDKWVYYESGKLRTLWKVSTETGEEIEVSDQKIYYPAFSPDGSFVAFFTRHGDKNRAGIAVMQVAEKNIVKTLDFAELQSLPVRIAWSGDSRTLNYVTWSEQGNILWEQSLDDAQPRHLADLGNKEVEYYSPAPDGSSYIFTRGEWLHNAVLIEGLK